LFHTRLIRLGFVPWSILCVAPVYALAHLPSPAMGVICLIGGLVFSYIFLKQPNIIPLGIAHGILGAITYHLLFGQDVFDGFIKSVGL